jgi:glycosyltransferase involved in cell wall biosynthesis
MRILVLSNLFPPGFIGGYELGALDMARGLAARGHQVEVLTSDYYPDDDGAIADLPVRRFLQCGGLNRNPSDDAGLMPGAAFIVPRNLRLLAAEIIRFRPDRVLCFNLSGLGTRGILQYLVGIGHRPVLFLMDDIFGGADQLRGRDGYEAVFGASPWLDKTAVIFMSQNLQQEVEGSLGRPVSRAALIPGWVDPGAAESQPPVPAPAAEDDLVRFVFASRVAPHKGIEIILSAARSLLDYGHRRFRIDVFGAGDVPQLLQFVTAQKLQNHVRYEGCPPKEALLRRYGEYDALLFPTWPREPFGFVVSEAAAAGCIPVMTSGIGAAEWFLNGQDALIIRNDVNGVVTAMLKLMSMDAGERRRMQQRARRTAQRFFGFGAALDRLEGVLAASGPAGEDASPATPRQARAAEAALSVLTEVWRNPDDG